jgi:hypothetical protein
MCVWAAATTSATDKAYAVVDGMSTSQFDNLFAMRLRFEILANPGELNWFESHGMPDPTGLQPYTRASPVDDGYATWTTFLAAYAARTDLATWVENKGRPVFERYVLTHPRKFASDFIKALPYMLAPPRTAVVYTTSVRDVLPDAVQSLVFDTPSDVRPTLGDVGLLAVALGVLSVVARRRTVDRTLVVVAAVGAVLAIGGLAASWIASPAEIARHAVPEAVLLRLSLWLGVFVGIDALQTPRIAPTRRGSSDRAARRWRAPSTGARSAAPRRERQA